MDTKKVTNFSLFKGNKLAIIFLGILIVALFFDFFSKGYVLDGLQDVRTNDIPLHIYKLQAVQEGTIPQWNPYIHCGTPFMGGGLDTLYYPFLFLIYLLPQSWMHFLITLLMVIHVFMAGVFAYMFFNRIIKDRFWALFSSVIYLFSTSSIINMTVGNSCFSFFVYLPLWLYLIKTYRDRKFLNNLIYTTLTLSMFFLIGMAQRLMYATWFAFIYILFESIKREGKNIRFDPGIILTNIASIVIAFFISGIRLVPFLVNAREGITAPVSFKEAMAYGYMPYEALMRFFTPEFFGLKLYEDFLFNSASIFANHFETFSAYIGVFGAFVFIYILFFVWDKRVLFWKIAFIFVMMMLLVTPFKYIHYILAMKSPLLYGRMAWFIPICAGAAIGIFGSRYWGNDKKMRELRIVSGIVFALVFTILVSLYKHYADDPANAVTFNAMQFSLNYFCILSAIFFIIIFLPNKKISKYFLLVFIAIDLLFIGRIESGMSLPLVSPRSSFNEYTDIELQLEKIFKEQGRLFRIYSFFPATNANQCISLGLYTSAGNDSFCSPYIARLYTGIYDLSAHKRSSLAGSSPKTPYALNLSSTAFALTPEGVLQNPEAEYIPRVRMYTDYIVISDEREAFKQLTMKTHNPREKVVINKEPSIEISQRYTRYKVSIIEERNERIKIETDADVNAILLLTDTYHRGWRAYVDGQAEEITRANFAFKAVVVPAGKHIVEFIFEHPAFKISIFSSLVGVCILLGLILISVFRPRFFAGRR